MPSIRHCSGWVGAWLAAGLLLTFGGLARIDYIHCSLVDKDYPVYLSNYVQARGFPLGWWVTDQSSCAAALGAWQRFLTVEFLRSCALNLVPAAVIALMTAWLRKRFSVQRGTS
jgi:hypothetical protein